MSILPVEDQVFSSHPLDTVEDIVTAHEWPFDRQGEDELSVCVSGAWCDYHLGFSFSDEQGGLQIACAYDMRVPPEKREPVYSLLAQLNERMWLGHFDLWSEEGIPMFRHAVLTREGPAPSSGQLEEMIEIAVSECERFFPALQFVMWGGKSPTEAIAAAMLETKGEA